MQFVVIGTPGEAFTSANTPDDLQEVLRAEWAMSRQYYKDGVLRNIWLLANYQGAVSIFEAESEEEMRSLLAKYPMEIKGYVKHVIHRLEPYLGFAEELAL